MKDWTEDFKYENGMYQNICKVCNSQFMGHKRRFVCKECSGQQQVKVEPEVKPESSGQFIKVWDSLPPIGKPVIIKTEYGKYDICYLRVENNNRLLWVNDMRPQHTDGSVIEWKEIE